MWRTPYGEGCRTRWAACCEMHLLQTNQSVDEVKGTEDVSLDGFRSPVEITFGCAAVEQATSFFGRTHVLVLV